MTFSQGAYRGQRMWKAVVRVAGEDTRYFGVLKRTMLESAEQVFGRDAFADRLLKAELDRVRSSVAALQQRHAGSQPSALASEPSSTVVTTSAKQGEDRCVAYIHQIYGVYRDNKPMPELFERSQQQWRRVASGMGAEYYLWSADELESLMKGRYRRHWSMYCNVRYPVMRVDIGRVAILHCYGGM